MFFILLILLIISPIFGFFLAMFSDDEKGKPAEWEDFNDDLNYR